MFITFEGLDFSGKTTQAARFVERVKAGASGSVLFLREPGGTKISERIREILLDREHLEMSPMAELLLFSASRSQLVQEVVLPALGRGETVVCDRFYDSTTAYQGHGRGLDLQAIGRINAIASAGLVPDLTIFVDIPIEEIGRRKAAAGVPFDRMESGGAEFYRRVRRGYQLMAEQEERFVRVNGMGTIDEIGAAIWQVYQDIQQKRSGT
jgi:dTMP kinase